MAKFGISKKSEEDCFSEGIFLFWEEGGVSYDFCV